MVNALCAVTKDLTLGVVFWAFWGRKRSGDWAMKVPTSAGQVVVAIVLGGVAVSLFGGIYLAMQPSDIDVGISLSIPASLLVVFLLPTYLTVLERS